MASDLQLKFETDGGVKTFTFKNVKPAATTTNIKALANGVIANGTLYKYRPLQVTGAKIVTTTETPIDLDE